MQAWLFWAELIHVSMANRGLAGGWYANLAQVVSHIWVSTAAAHLHSSLTHLPTGWPGLLLVTG